MINEYDPYLEGQGTLWVVHTLLDSNRELAMFWYIEGGLIRVRGVFNGRVKL